MQPMHNKHRIATLLALTAALAGCGGGTDKNSTPAPAPAPAPAPTPAPAPVPSAPIGVNFVLPSNNVLEASASDGLVVNVAVNGSPAPNGTSVTLEVNPAAAATVAPVAPTTVGGVARATLSVGSSLPTSATFQVKASAVSQSNTATDTVTYYVRPTPKDLQVLVPAYFSGTGTSSPWNTLTAGATSYPKVQITAIANPHSGILTPNTEVNADVLTAMTAFRAVTKPAGDPSNRVVGYVATASGSSGALSVTDVKATIDNYIRLYPGVLDGFFLDGMSADSTRLAYFQDIYTYVKSLDGGKYSVIGNPGTYPAAAYAIANSGTGVADVLVTYAGNAAAYQAIDPQPANPWVYAKDNTAQAMLVHTASTCTDMQTALAKANTPRMNTGMVYVTNLTIGTPWSALPTYWLQLLGTVDAINQRRTLPSC